MKTKYEKQIRYYVKELTDDGLLKDPQEMIPYSAGMHNSYNVWHGYETREEAHQAIYDKEIKESGYEDDDLKSNWRYSSPEYVVLEMVRWVPVDE